MDLRLRKRRLLHPSLRYLPHLRPEEVPMFASPRVRFELRVSQSARVEVNGSASKLMVVILFSSPSTKPFVSLLPTSHSDASHRPVSLLAWPPNLRALRLPGASLVHLCRNSEGIMDTKDKICSISLGKHGDNVQEEQVEKAWNWSNKGTIIIDSGTILVVLIHHHDRHNSQATGSIIPRTPPICCHPNKLEGIIKILILS